MLPKKFTTRQFGIKNKIKIVNLKRFVKKFRSIFLVEESGKKSSYKEIDCL
jgi:hypothetical protein